MCHDHLEYYLESAMWDNSCVCATWHISLPVSLAGSNYAQIRGTDFDYYFKVNCCNFNKECLKSEKNFASWLTSFISPRADALM